MDNKFILDGITWSFSSVNCYAQCPRMFLMQYVDCLSKTNNAFAEWGSFGHLLLEKYYKGELEFFELSEAFKKGYDEHVKLRFPPNKYVNLNETYYRAGKEYFDGFDGDFEDCEVLGVEQKINLSIHGYPFVGYIDLILKSKEGIIICDHKSKSKFKNKKEKQAYLRQLYLYSEYIYQQYGEYPVKLIFNMFRTNTKVEEIFAQEAFEDAKVWFVATIEKIFMDESFAPHSDEFFCNWLCSVNHHCPSSDKYIEI